MVMEGWWRGRRWRRRWLDGASMDHGRTDGRPHLVRGDLRLASEAHLVVTLTLSLEANVEAMAVALAALVLIESSMVSPRS